MKWSSASQRSGPRPSISTISPPAITSDGSGSSGPSIATSPSSARGSISTSRLRSRCSRATKRAERSSGGKETPLRIDAQSVAHERRVERRTERLEPLRPRLELARGGAARPQCGVDLGKRLLGEHPPPPPPPEGVH